MFSSYIFVLKFFLHLDSLWLVYYISPCSTLILYLFFFFFNPLTSRQCVTLSCSHQRNVPWPGLKGLFTVGSRWPVSCLSMTRTRPSATSWAPPRLKRCNSLSASTRKKPLGLETFFCLRRWLWFRQQGSLQQASKWEVFLVFLGQGLDLELQLALLEEEQVLGLDLEMLLVLHPELCLLDI